MQNSRDITEIVVSPLANNALNITSTIADEKGESLAENLVAFKNGGGNKMKKMTSLRGYLKDLHRLKREQDETLQPL